MSQYTEYYNLKKPAQSESYDIDVANSNNSIIDIALHSKVDKKAGKGLSTNDFTNEYKKKIDSMQTLYRFKGTVDNINDLLLINNCNIGDVYRCKEDMNNYVWNKIEWINIGQDNDFTNILNEIKLLKNEKVKKTGDTMTGILRFENKKEFSGIEKTRTIDDIDYVAKIGIGAVKSIGLEISANGEIKGRLDIMADGTVKNYKTGNLLVEEGKWITATLNSGVKATNTGLGGFKGIRYRKIGNHVYVIGSISTTWDGTNPVVLTTLPEGYRPKLNNYVFCPLTSSNIARIYIANDGKVILEWVKSIVNGSNVTTELSWVGVKADFFVD